MKLKEHLFSFDNRGLITEHGIMADDWMLGKQNVIARYLWLHTPFILLRGWNRFLTLKQMIHAITFLTSWMSRSSLRSVESLFLLLVPGINAPYYCTMSLFVFVQARYPPITAVFSL